MVGADGQSEDSLGAGEAAGSPNERHSDRVQSLEEPQGRPFLRCVSRWPGRGHLKLTSQVVGE